MKTREWMERAGAIESEICALKDTIIDVEGRLYSVTGNIDGVKVKGGMENAREENLYRYLHLKEMLDRKIGLLYTAKSKILVAIERLENPLYRALLTERYINRKSIPQIAETMHYSERWVCKLIDRALAEAER